MPKQLLLAILAAGASSRLGTPKQLLSLANESLLHRQCRIALETNLGSVVAILGCQAEQCRAAIADLPVEVALNHEWQEGMASSIRIAASLAQARGCDGLLIVLVDQYLLESADLLQLAAAWQNDETQIAISVNDEYQGPPVLFPAAYFSELNNLQGDQGAKSLLQQLPAAALQKVMLPRASTDCDQFADLKKLESVGELTIPPKKTD